ncbi:MAG: GAF domain-containing protein [Chloroflexi bacterium]|nr:GAF domain-containing protein [Chloroflexota bacterium]
MRLNLSIGQRTALGFLLMILLVLIASGTGLLYTTAVENTVNTTRSGVDQVQSVANLQVAWLNVVATLDTLLLTRQTSLIEERQGQLDDFQQQLDALAGQELGSTQRYVQRNAEVLSSLQALGDDLGEVVQEIHAVALEGRWARAQSLRHTDLASLQRRLNDGLDQLSANIRSDVTASVEESADAQNRNRVFWTITAVASVIIGVVAGFLTVTSITRPIRGLMQAAAAIRAGDLSRRARIESSDEIGELAEVFNSMTERLRSSIENLEDRVSARTRDLQIAADVSRQVTTVLDIEQLLQQVVALTAKNYGLYACSVYLPSEDGRELFQAAGADFVGQPLDVPELRRIPYDADPSVIALAARTRKPVTVNDVGESKEYLSLSALSQTRSELSIPMLLGNRVLGIFDLQSTSPDRFGEEDLRVLNSLAEQIAVAVRNAQLFAQVEASREAAEEASRVKSQFLANMSHELRTPLNAILNFSGFIADGVLGSVNSEQQDVLQKVIGSSHHLLSLINDILDLTKIEVGMMDLFLEEVDMNAALGASIATAKGLVKDTSIDLQVDIEDDLPQIVGDKRRIRQIMLNLISNAVKFTPEGAVRISARREDDAIYLAVSDTGIGIPEDQREVIFETFRQAKHDLPETPGTGLGLPIARHFVEAHGGRMWFDSEVGEGTTFHILLPIRAPEYESDSEPNAQMVPGR